MSMIIKKMEVTTLLIIYCYTDHQCSVKVSNDLTHSMIAALLALSKYKLSSWSVPSFIFLSGDGQLTVSGDTIMCLLAFRLPFTFLFFFYTNMHAAFL